MQNDVMVTVICTAYNHSKYIKKALDGFVMQKTNFNFEVIVHDDASTDNTAQIVEYYCEKHDNLFIPILQNQNQQSRHINVIQDFILPKVHGKYIALCEGDDYWTDCNKLQVQFDYMEAHGECPLVVHQALRVNESGDFISVYSKKLQREEDYDLAFSEVVRDLSLFPTASMFYRRSFYDVHEKLLTDIFSYDYVIKLLLASLGVVHVMVQEMSAYREAANGSWTVRIGQVPERYIVHLKESISVLEKINNYFNHRFADDITSEILRRQYEIEEKKYNIKALKKEPYSCIYRKKGYRYKTALYMRKYTPKLFYMVKKGLIKLHAFRF